MGSVVATTWMWARAGGVQQTFVHPEFAVESQALYTGLLSSVLMILQVFFLARIPWVEQSWGHDVLARRHKWLGYASFWLMIAHVFLLAIQRVERSPDAQLAALWAVFVTDSWMLWATIGTAMIIAVVITSIQIARRKLRYESWHLIHLYAYLGMALALPHQTFDGMHFHETWTQVFWWGMYVAALVATLVWRVAVPLWRSFYHRLRVTEIVQETAGAFTIIMYGHHLDRLRTKSGQFFIWRFLGNPGWTRGNPFSISAAPTNNQLSVTIEATGDGARRAASVPVGSRVLIEGPYDAQTAERRRHARMVMIAAGVGVTPFRGILEDADYGPTKSR